VRALNHGAIADSQPPSSRPQVIVGIPALARFLNEHGYPIATSTLAKFTMPTASNAVPSEGYWGRLPVFVPAKVLAWCSKRVESNPSLPSERRRCRPRKPQLTPQSEQA